MEGKKLVILHIDEFNRSRIFHMFRRQSGDGEKKSNGIITSHSNFEIYFSSPSPTMKSIFMTKKFTNMQNPAIPPTVRRIPFACYSTDLGSNKQEQSEN